MQVRALVRSVVVLCALSALLPSRAAVVYVNKNAPGAVHDGKSWETAFTTVQAGVNAAVSQDEVWVAQGTYNEAVTTKEGVALYGGFIGTEASKEGRDWVVHASVLSGSWTKDRTVTVETPGCVLDGFRFLKTSPKTDYPLSAVRVRDVSVTINNCWFSGGFSLDGYSTGIEVVGGTATISNCSFDWNQQAVYLLASPAPALAQSHATISGCRFTYNKYGVEALNSVADVADCTFTSSGGMTSVNALQSGAASVSRCTIAGGATGVMADSTSTATVSDCSFTSVDTGVARAQSVTRCTFTSNTSGASDCGTVSNCVFLRNSTAVSRCTDVENCTISAGNTGVYVNGTTTLTNCTITGTSYRGVYVYSGPAIISNCIVAFNQAGIQRYSSAGDITLSHNDVYGNVSANYVNVTDPTGQNGNISVDPLITNPYHDVHTQPGSPCVETGNDALVKAGSTDIDGQPRRIGAHVDIGSDESDGTTWTVPARTWYVSTTGDDYDTGLSWSHAKRTIRSAVAAAQGLDEVWVARGTYYETASMPEGVGLYGGFAGGETTRAERDWKANPTVIDPSSNPAVHLPYMGGILDGFTLARKRYVDNYGVLVSGYAVATIRNCTFTGFAYGIRVDSTFGSVVSDCTFTGNDFGIWGSTNATRCVFSAHRYSGVHVTAGPTTLSNCVITGNTSGVSVNQYMGAVNPLPMVTVDNCTLSRNTTGVSVADKNALTIRNSIVAFNQAGIKKSGTTSSVTASHVDVFGNSAGNFAGLTDFTGTDGNVSVDPRFMEPARDDVRLRSSSPCVDAGDDSAVTAKETDLVGNPRKAGAHADIGAYEVQPAVSAALDAAVAGPPAALDGMVYAATANGKLYAFANPTLTPLAGFPVDISQAVATPVKLNTRPAVYYGRTGKAIYLTTNLGHVMKVTPDGKVAWIQQPLGGPALSTPAVTPDGNVYVDLGFGTGSVLNFAFKLDETTGQPKYISPYLGISPADSALDRSLAVDARYCYLNASTQTMGSLAVLNQDNLTVRASFAPGEEALPPFISGGELVVATKQGHLYKLNGITMSPELAFGTLGTVTIGEAVTAGPFAFGGAVYLGTASGKIVRVNEATGVKSLFLDSQTNSAITGLVITSTGTLGLTTQSGTLQQVPIANLAGRQATNLGGAPAGGPVYDPVQARFFAVTTAGKLYSIPAI